MSRSYSESSVKRGQSTPPLSSFSNLGPNRQRSNTVTSDKDKNRLSPGGGDLTEANRSRSSSFLERFALGNKGRKKSDDAQRDVDDAAPTEKAVSPARSGSTTPSRFSTPSMPAIPSLGSLKKLPIGSGSKYGSLGDSHEVLHGRSSPVSSPTKRPTPPLPERRRPTSPTATRTSPVGSTYRAQWSYVPSSSSTSTASSEDDSHDISFEKGDVVRVEGEINADWWSAVVVEGTWKGQRGTVPSAYFVRCEGADERARSVPRIRTQRYSTGSEMTVSSEGEGATHSTEDEGPHESSRLHSSNPFGDD